VLRAAVLVTTERQPMAQRTSSTIGIAAEPSAIMAVIADLEAYPEWAGSVKSVEVLSVYDDAEERPAEAKFTVDAGPVKDSYVLEYTWDGDREVRWTLEKAEMLTAMDGAYRLTPGPGGVTDVEYELVLELRIPMIGLLRRKAEKAIIDIALKELKKRVEG
jgi:ribosome-associated toxin RatA of RatAB toxin-antitoxin module